MAQAQTSFARLPTQVRSRINFSLQRSSDRIAASPFATVISFLANINAAEDAISIQEMKDLGLKHLLLYNAEKQLGESKNPRLNQLLSLCEQADIEVRCKVDNPDVDFWKKVVSNYGSRIQHYYYLNEPNVPKTNDFSSPRVSPETYVSGLGKVRGAITKINPKIKLYGPEVALLQCMESKPYPWIPLAIDAGLLDYVDGISFHPYRQSYNQKNVPENPSTFDGKPTSRYDSYIEQIQVLKEMVKGKPISVTEAGWSTAIPKAPITPFQSGIISELTQAKFLLRQQIMDFAVGMEMSTFFLLRDRHVDRPYPKGHIENSFGIVRENNSPKVAFVALQSLYALLDNNSRLNTSVKIQFNDPRVVYFVFDDPSPPYPKRKIFYWLPVPASDSFATQKVDLQIEQGKMPALALSDSPRLLQLYQIDGRWGYPVAVNLLTKKAQLDLSWQS
jgi:hypothetical protein